MSKLIPSIETALTIADNKKLEEIYFLFRDTLHIETIIRSIYSNPHLESWLQEKISVDYQKILAEEHLSLR